MSNLMKIINGEWWEIKEIPIKNGFFYVINTHRKEGVLRGCTQPDDIEKFTSKEDAIKFLEKKFNESRNKNCHF